MTSLITPTRRALIGGLVAAPFVLTGRARAQLSFSEFPFQLGVAAGDMTPDGFILWTRLAQKPLEPNGGMPMKPVAVDWQVATDEGFKQIVAKGTEQAWPELAHSLHIDVTGMKPATRYFYRFICEGLPSYVGSVTTLPAPGATVDKVRFAAVGCQHLEHGWYTAYRDAARQNPDFMFHYGDYIYEYHDPWPRDREGLPITPVRRYSRPTPMSLEDYRVRYADTKLDGDLQAAHAVCGWYCTYDDHEVENNWASIYDQENDPPEMFVYRRRAALQAWYEHMPVRCKPTADGIVDFHRRVDYGSLARFHYPNTRLYRSDQPCGDNFKPDCAARHAPGQDMLNAAQWSWLEEGFRSSRNSWNIVPQQVMLAIPDRREPGGSQPIYNMDSWGGYPAAQQHLLEIFAKAPGGNVLVVTGDEHRNYANDLILRDKIVASEFVSTSITSNGDRPDDDNSANILANNSFVKWINDQRGYVMTEVTREGCVGDYRTVETVEKRDAPVATAAKWAVASGKPGLVRA
ncbi:alkaline phosphatase D family protein [Sphingomonas sp. CGMCC 1.13654]|uniref:Alkaline phosphatase D family protein n=1 Tax=Sphingomonas chungangi TaxID=2683589 RepID=A0A838L7M8_9SPHN|nr:alkaline phosphatase D family protein [Sphingomonas chungangi]MBA2934920.1 alkaline phosphatase D family protein [Sphingomonas chungangi]MVW58231.1 alkaline phosphatase [Sphingomonas chungangi]